MDPVSTDRPGAGLSVYDGVHLHYIQLIGHDLDGSQLSL